MDLSNVLIQWKAATAALPPGVQSLCLDTLKLAAAGKVRLTHSADVFEGVPCLFNAIRNMTTQLNEAPIEYAPMVVVLFDRINTALIEVGVNQEGHAVSPLAAEILAHNFGPLKEITMEDKARLELERASFVANCSPYFEPTDEELITDWLLSIEDTDYANPTRTQGA